VRTLRGFILSKGVVDHASSIHRRGGCKSNIRPGILNRARSERAYRLAPEQVLRLAKKLRDLLAKSS